MIKFAKVRDVKSPKRGNGGFNDRSAGIDFFIPEWSADFADTLRRMNKDSDIVPPFHAQSGVGGSILVDAQIYVEPHSHILIPSGIVCNLQSSSNFLYDVTQGLALIAFNKSSIGIKQLDCAAQVIDEDYAGEIHISIMNTSKNRVQLNFGEKIIQFAIVPILLDEFQECKHHELFDSETERGSNGFGSTGKH